MPGRQEAEEAEAAAYQAAVVVVEAAVQVASVAEHHVHELRVTWHLTWGRNNRRVKEMASTHPLQVHICQHLKLGQQTRTEDITSAAALPAHVTSCKQGEMQPRAHVNAGFQEAKVAGRVVRLHAPRQVALGVHPPALQDGTFQLPIHDTLCSTGAHACKFPCTLPEDTQAAFGGAWGKIATAAGYLSSHSEFKLMLRSHSS